MPNTTPVTPQHTVSITIFEDPSKPATLTISGIPWYAGITVLQAMIMADSMTPATFSFRAVYASIYGAFIDKINKLEDQGNNYWMLFVNGVSASVGASTQLIVESDTPVNVDIEWKYQPYSTTTANPQVAKKIKALSA